jgi:hypothetical protein
MIELNMAAIAIVSRLLVVRRSVIAFDTYGHLYFAKLIREQKTGPFGAITARTVGATAHSAPYLWNWIISLFPIDHVVRVQKWINPAIDAAFAILIFFVARQVGFERDAASLITLLYLLTPAWFSRFGPPRIASFTPRLVSELGTNLFFIVTLLPLGIPFWISLLVAAAICAFVILSSKFGAQAMLLLTPLVSLITWQPGPLVALILGVLCAVAVSRFSFVIALAAQSRHLFWYFRKNLRGEMEVSGRNSIRELFARPANCAGRLDHLRTILYRATTRNSYTSVLLKMPVWTVAVALYIWSYSRGQSSEVSVLLMGPVIAGSILFILVNMPLLLFLGEAERYLHHVAFFIVGAAVALATQMGLHWILWVLVAWGTIVLVFESFLVPYVLPSWKRTALAADDAVVDHLRGLEEAQVVLAYPYGAVGVFRILLETKHTVVYPLMSRPDFTEEFEEKFAADYPYVHIEKLDQMAEELNVSYVIVHKKSLKSRGLFDWEPSSQWEKLGVGEPRHAVYQRGR